MKDIKTVSQETYRSSDEPGYTALKESAAVVNLHKSILRLTGKDPVGMLNAVLTNDVPEHGERGAYAFLLNPKGRIQTDLCALKSGDGVLIITELEGASAALEILGRYAPFSRVKVEDLSDSWRVLGLYGPLARNALEIPELAEHETAEVEVGRESLLAVGVEAPVPGYDLIGPSDIVSTAGSHLLEGGATSVESASYETIRIEAGLPRFGTDITPDNFPGETGVLSKSVNFGKGCYPGQETVARMHYRGHPNKTLHRLAPEGVVDRDTDIVQNGKVVGKITSIAPLPLSGKTFALGYLSRNTDPEAPLRAGEIAVSSLGPVRG